MIPYEHPELFKQDSISKQLTVTFTDGTFTNADILFESFSLTEKLITDTQLEFGLCTAGQIKFEVAGNFIALKDKELTLSITPQGGSSVPLGVYKVESDVPTADRSKRTVTAYDAIADILNMELVDWYNGLFPNEGDTVTCLQMRNSLFTYLGIQQENVSLINDSVEIPKTISTTSLSGKDVLYCICQLNGVFGRMSRDGKFKYVSIDPIGEEALYPSEELYPDEDLYPYGGREGIIPEKILDGNYVGIQYEDYIVESIDKVQIRMQENDIGCIVGTGTNAFILENNFLLFGKSSEELQPIATALLNKVQGLYFRPTKMTLVGNPLRELGDGLRIATKNVLIETYVLNRTLKGIQALKDDISSEADQTREECLTDTHHQLMQLLGKSNVLERTIEQTQSTIEDVAEGLQTQITQNAEAITGKASKQDGDVEEFAYRLTSEKFELIANEETIFKCDKNGITVIGMTDSSYVATGFLRAIGIYRRYSQGNYSWRPEVYPTSSYYAPFIIDGYGSSPSLTYSSAAGGWVFSNYVSFIRRNVVSEATTSSPFPPV